MTKTVCDKCKQEIRGTAFHVLVTDTPIEQVLRERMSLHPDDRIADLCGACVTDMFVPIGKISAYR